MDLRQCCVSPGMFGQPLGNGKSCHWNTAGTGDVLAETLPSAQAAVRIYNVPIYSHPSPERASREVS